MNEILFGAVVPIFLLGSTVLAIIYHLVLYFYSKDKLLIHYLLYLFFTSVFIFQSTGFIEVFVNEKFQNYYLKNLNEATQIMYLAFYFNFILQSIEVERKKSTFLFRSWIVIMSILTLYSILNYITKLNNLLSDYTIPFTLIRVFIFTLTSIMLYRCFKLRNLTFQKYILIGCSVYFIFGLISFITNLYVSDKMLINPPVWLMIGSFVDIIFFSIAISYRNKKQWESMNLVLLKDANDIIAMQKLVLEKQAALENERSRIAADMHDDLGSGLTKITYLSQMAMSDLNSKDNLAKIKKTSADLVENMSEIIWAMKEDNNTLEDLVTYIKIYASDYLESNNLKLTIIIPETVDLIVVKGNHRKNLFLCVKEALHNVVKHSKAKNVFINITINEFLKITIVDDGIGFEENSENYVSGNGLRNMKKRIENINGTLIFSSNKGTSITINAKASNLFE